MIFHLPKWKGKIYNNKNERFPSIGRFEYVWGRRPELKQNIVEVKVRIISFWNHWNNSCNS